MRPTLALLAIPGCLFPQGMGSPVRVSGRPSPLAKSAPAPPRIDFQDRAAAWGLNAPNVYGGVDKKRTILEMSGNGAVLSDFDNDGRPDLFLPSGTRTGVAPPGAVNRLYRNVDGKRFEEAAASGLARQGWNQGACAADIDNDGLTDLAIAGYGSNALFRNTGKLRFADITRSAGLPLTGKRWATSCVFFDYDRDGLVDLFFSNYVGFDLAAALAPGSSPYCLWRGLPVFCGPRGMPGGASVLYRNLGGGRFEDVSARAGIVVKGLHYGLGAVSSDFDDDGWPDLYVACDSTAGLLYMNNRDGTFRELAVPAGAAYGDAGQEQGSMGVAAGDYDGDGRIDIVKTNFMDETPALYRNEGERFFTDETFRAGLGLHTKFVGWGVEFADVDNDGRLDLLMAHGHIYPEIDTAKSSERFRQSKLLYWNAGKALFVDATASSGPALSEPKPSRGLAAADLDGDGGVDFVVVNMNDKPSMLVNGAPRGNWLAVDLAASKSNRRAVGARVVIEAGGVAQVREVRAGGSYGSQSDFRLHFGLGARDRVDKIRVRWPHGAWAEHPGTAANQVVTIREQANTAAVRGGADAARR